MAALNAAINLLSIVFNSIELIRFSAKVEIMHLIKDKRPFLTSILSNALPIVPQPLHSRSGSGCFDWQGHLWMTSMADCSSFNNSSILCRACPPTYTHLLSRSKSSFFRQRYPKAWPKSYLTSFNGKLLSIQQLLHTPYI